MSGYETVALSADQPLGLFSITRSLRFGIANWGQRHQSILLQSSKKMTRVPSACGASCHSQPDPFLATHASLFAVVCQNL
eukprot:264026-Amphidinium_carterae.1